MHDQAHSFIIPAYGESTFLEACILSLQRQTVPSNIILTTSTPNAFLSNMASRYHIELRINENSKGIASDWTFAYRQGQTKYVTLAHQDDLYLPDYTEKCLQLAERSENRDVLILFTDYGEISGNKPRGRSAVLHVKRLMLFPFFLRHSLRNSFMKKLLLSFGNPVSCPTVMFNKENTGRLEFSGKYSYIVDWEAWLQLAGRRGSFIYVDKPLMLHRLHPGSQTIIQIGDNNRLLEEEMIFGEIWGRKSAKFLMTLYRYGAKFNSRGGKGTVQAQGFYHHG